MRCKRGLCCHAVSVCLSVCPSVRLSRLWITSKRINISAKFLNLRVATPFYFFPYQRGCRYSDRNPPNGSVECKGVLYNDDFSQISRCISETVILRWAHAAKQFVNIEFSFHPCIQYLAWLPQGHPRENKNVVKIAIFGLTHWLNHRITRKLLKIYRYMLRGV